MTRSRVLVLLACRNGDKWLRSQIDSVLTQRDVDVRILVGDDASTDDTAAIAMIYGEDGHPVELCQWREASGSAGANFRRIFREVDPGGAEFIALADQDDIWTPDKLAEAIAQMSAVNASGYSSAVLAVWDDGRQRLVKPCSIVREADFLFESAGQGCTYVLRRDFFLDVQRFCRSYRGEADALHYHDWLVYLLARSRGRNWRFDPVPHIRYRQHASNEIGSRGGISALRRRVALIRNGWYLQQIRAATVLALAAGAEHQVMREFSELINSSHSIQRRLRLSWFVLLHGRRRLSDRLVLMLSTLAGWI